MKKTLILILALLLVAQLAACSLSGGENSTPLPSSASESTDVWGVTVEETQTGTTKTPEIGNTATNVTEDTVQLDEAETAELSTMVMALVMCDFADNMQYDPQDSQFFWRAMNYYAATVCYDMDALSEDMSWAVFSEEQVKSFAGRMFAELETLPALPDIAMIQRWEDGTYAFTLGNFGDVALELGEMQVSANGRYLMDVTLVSSEETLGTWSVEFMRVDEQYCISGILYG